MKKVLIILSAILFAANAMAFVGRTQRGYKNGDTAKLINDGGDAL